MRGWQKAVALASLALASCVPTFETKQRTPFDAPRGYARFFAAQPYSFRYVQGAVGEPVRRGAKAERFELRDGDCAGSDCGNPRYRTEIRMSEEFRKARVGRDIWYGWSFYNATIPQFTREDSLRIVLGQWTTGGQSRPAVRLIQLGQDEGNWQQCSPNICTGPEVSQGDVVVQLEDMRTAMGWGPAQNNGYICRLFDSQQMRNRWVDITMTTNFSTESDGYLQIWVDDVLKCNYRGPILSQASLLERRRPEHRRGIFASFTKRWDAHTGGKAKPTLIAYYDEFLSGFAREEVDVRMRERAGLRAVD